MECLEPERQRAHDGHMDKHHSSILILYNWFACVIYIYIYTHKYMCIYILCALLYFDHLGTSLGSPQSFMQSTMRIGEWKTPSEKQEVDCLIPAITVAPTSLIITIVLTTMVQASLRPCMCVCNAGLLTCASMRPYSSSCDLFNVFDFSSFFWLTR